MITLPIWAIVLIVIAAIIVVVLLTWSYFTAQRLHRMHKRCDQAAMALGGALDRRAFAVRAAARSMRRNSASAELPESEVWELLETADMLVSCVQAVETRQDSHKAHLDQRESAENALSLVLNRSVLTHVDREEMDDLHEALIRLNIARRFYNNAVQEAQSLHARKSVRLFHLAGYAPAPQFFNIIEDTDDGSESDSSSSFSSF